MTKFEKQEIFLFKKMIHYLIQCKSIESIRFNIFQKRFVNEHTNEVDNCYQVQIYLETLDFKKHSLFLAPTHLALYQEDKLRLEKIASQWGFHFSLMAHQNFDTKKILMMTKRHFNSQDNLFLAQLYEQYDKKTNANDDNVCITIEKQTNVVSTRKIKKDSIFQNIIKPALMSKYENKRLNSHIKNTKPSKTQKI